MATERKFVPVHNYAPHYDGVCDNDLAIHTQFHTVLLLAPDDEMWLNFTIAH